MTRSGLIAIALCLVCTPSLFAQDTDLIARGKKVYDTEKCRVCHSVGTEGNKKGPLDDVGSKLSADELRQWIVNATEMNKKAKSTRKPPMKDYKHLAKEDVDALVAYMQSLKKS